MGDRWSIAWRVHDAQFWGVPQRRRRIALVADFGGQSAPEILFERESVCGNITKSGTAWQGTAADAERSANETISFLERAGCQGGVKEYSYSENGQEHCQHLTINQCCNISGTDISGTLDSHYYLGCGARGGKEREAVAFGISAYNSNAMKSNNPYSGIYEADKARTLDKNGGSPACNQGGIAVWYNKQRCDKFVENNVASTMSARQYKDESDVVVDSRGRGNGNIAPTMAVRRLTPLECERLQNFPDHWTDIGDWTDSKGKKHKNADSPRYKALGNSIALPFWQWLADRICAQYNRETTMASLFDGIGGFPLVFTRAGAKAVWNSEVEPFCEAVTKLRFGEERTELTNVTL